MAEEGPLWAELSADKLAEFLRFHRAELEIVRSQLPVRVVRKTVDKNGTLSLGMPVAIYTCTTSDFKDYHAFIWQIPSKIDTQRDNLVGYVRLSPTEGVISSSKPPDCLGGTLDPFSSYTPVPFGEYFWPGPEKENVESQQLAESVSREAIDSLADKEKQSSGTIERHESPSESDIRKAMDNIQNGFTVEDSKEADEKAIKRWGRHPRVLSHTDNEFQRLGRRLEQEVINFTLVNEKISVVAFDLPFYRDYCLYQITDRRGLRSRSAYVVVKGQSQDSAKYDEEAPLCAINNASSPIHQFNNRLSSRNDLVITEDTAADYLTFFCRFVHGELGAFKIIETANDLRWLFSHRDSRNKKAVEDALRPVQCLTPVRQNTSEDKNVSEAHVYYYSAFLCYGRNLFFARLEVKSDGTVQMPQDASFHNNDLPIVPIIFDRETEFVLQLDPEKKSSEGAW